MKKILAVVCAALLALCCVLPAIAESEPVDLIQYLGADPDTVGPELGLEKTLTEGEDGAELTSYDSDDISLAGKEGKIINITLFGGNYCLCGVTVGMTEDDAKAALDAAGIAYEDDEIAEIEAPVITFTIEGYEDLTGSFTLEDGVVTEGSIA